MATPKSTIDSLPEAERQKVIDSLLAGESLRQVSKRVGISHVAVGTYKRKVLLPAIQQAQRINALQAIDQSPVQQAKDVTTLTRASLAAEPFIARIAKHQGTIDSAIEAASAKKDGRTIAALVGTDLKGVELHAKLAGALSDAPQTTVNLAFVAVPGSGGGGRTLDVTAEECE